MDNNLQKLQNIRQTIDNIDNKITELLKTRSLLIPEVAKIKDSWKQKIAFKRELEQKHLINNRDFGLYNKLAMQKIWREIIGATLQIECKLTVALFKASSSSLENDFNLWEVAKDHFGVSSNLLIYNNLNNIIQDIKLQKLHCVVLYKNDAEVLLKEFKDLTIYLTLPEENFLTFAKANINNVQNNNIIKDNNICVVGL